MDKVKHFFYSAGLVVALNFLLPLLLSMSLVLIVGVAKEIHDYYNPKGYAEWLDLLADVGGILLGCGVCLLLKYSC